MKINEIKKTVEQVVRTEYIAEDGTIFDSEQEAKRYEQSALFVVGAKLKRLTAECSQYDFNDQASCEDPLEVFNVENEEDLENLKRYIYLTLAQNKVSEKTIDGCFNAENDSRRRFVINNITVGHEVLIFWSYYRDWCWVYNDGSVEGYCNWVKENYQKLINKVEK